MRIAIELMQTEDKNVRIENILKKIKHVLRPYSRTIEKQIWFSKDCRSKTISLVDVGFMEQ